MAFEDDFGAEAGGTPADAAPQAEQEFEVKIDGQVQRVPLSELTRGYSRHADYTRKTTELANKEREWQGKLQQYESAMGEIAGFLDSREQLEAYIQKRFAQQQAAAGVPPQQQQYLTPEQLQKAMAKMEQQQTERLTALQTEIAVNQMSQQMGQKIDAKLSTLKQQHPNVFFRPGMERLIREEVMQLGPRSIEDALAAFEQVVTGYARDLAKTTGAPKVPGIEPPGGTAVLPPGQEEFSDVRDPRLREQVMQDILRGMKRE